MIEILLIGLSILVFLLLKPYFDYLLAFIAIVIPPTLYAIVFLIFLILVIRFILGRS